MKCPECQNEMTKSQKGWLCLHCGHVATDSPHAVAITPGDTTTVPSEPAPEIITHVAATPATPVEELAEPVVAELVTTPAAVAVEKDVTPTGTTELPAGDAPDEVKSIVAAAVAAVEPTPTPEPEVPTPPVETLAQPVPTPATETPAPLLEPALPELPPSPFTGEKVAPQPDISSDAPLTQSTPNEPSTQIVPEDIHPAAAPIPPELVETPNPPVVEPVPEVPSVPTPAPAPQPVVPPVLAEALKPPVIPGSSPRSMDGLAPKVKPAVAAPAPVAATPAAPTLPVPAPAAAVQPETHPEKLTTGAIVAVVALALVTVSGLGTAGYFFIMK